MTHCLRYESAKPTQSAIFSSSVAVDKRTFDGGVIFVDEMALDQLNCQTGLSHTSTSDDDQLVFSEKLHGMTVSNSHADNLTSDNPLLKPF